MHGLPCASFAELLRIAWQKNAIHNCLPIHVGFTREKEQSLAPQAPNEKKLQSR